MADGCGNLGDLLNLPGLNRIFLGAREIRYSQSGSHFACSRSLDRFVVGVHSFSVSVMVYEYYLAVVHYCFGGYIEVCAQGNLTKLRCSKRSTAFQGFAQGLPRTRTSGQIVDRTSNISTERVPISISLCRLEQRLSLESRFRCQKAPTSVERKKSDPKAVNVRR